MPLRQKWRLKMHNKNGLFYTSTTLFLSLCAVGIMPNAVAADESTQSPDAVYFSKSWCPHPADLDELDKLMFRIMDGCCISTGFLNAEGKNNPSALVHWDKYRRNAPQTDACVATPAAKPEVNLTKEELERYAELERETQKARVQIRKEGIKNYVALVRKLERNEFCHAYGEINRGRDLPNDMSAADAKDVIKKEAARRKISFNDKLVLNEKIKVGISQCHMYASWGTPDDENRSVGSWGVHIQHVYGRSYVYTENGRVTSYQN